MFENSLVETIKRPRPKWRIWAFPLAVVLHLVGLAGMLFAQVWNVPPVPEPPLRVSFFQAAAPPPPPPPPPPPAPPKPKVETPKPVEVKMPTEPVQPVEIPKEIPKPTEEVVDTGLDTGLDFGVEGGVEGGVAGGVVGGVPGGIGEAPPPPKEEILRVGGDITRPEAITKVNPVYPEAARRARIQGVVIVEAVIDTNGNVNNVKVLKGLPLGLDNAAAEAVKKWKFKPAMLNGRPVKVYFTLTVNFTLQ
jgi:periplasmic protein TonB